MKIRKKLINEDLGDIEELDTTAVVPPAMEDQKEKSIDREKELEKQGIVTDAEKIVKETEPVISDSKPKPENPIEFKTKVNESIDTDNLDQKIDEFVMDIEGGAIKEGVGATLLTAAKFVGTHYEAILAALAAAGITAVELVEDYEKIMKKLDDGKKERQSTIGGADQGDTAIGVTESFNKSDVDVKIGDTIRIDEVGTGCYPEYVGRTGVVEIIDDEGQIHGTWGGCALKRKYGDKYTVIGHKMEESIENGFLEVGDAVKIDFSTTNPKLIGKEFRVKRINDDGSIDCVGIKNRADQPNEKASFNPNYGDRFTIVNNQNLDSLPDGGGSEVEADRSLWTRIDKELCPWDDGQHSAFLRKETLFPNFAIADRYDLEQVQPQDYGIRVVADSEDELLFANKVAERYGLEYENVENNGKWICKIYIDDENYPLKKHMKDISDYDNYLGFKSNMSADDYDDSNYVPKKPVQVEQ